MSMIEAVNAQRTEFDALTQRMTEVNHNLQDSPAIHAPLHQAALESSYDMAINYLREHPELATLYGELGDLALTVSEVTIDAQKKSLDQLKGYVADGLIPEEAVVEEEDILARNSFIVHRKPEFQTYKQLFGSIEPVQTPPAAPPAPTPPKSKPKPRGPNNPKPQVPEINLGENGEWRRPTTVEAIRMGLLDETDRRATIDVPELHRQILVFALRCDNQEGFNMQELRTKLRSVSGMDDKQYRHFKQNFPRIREEIVIAAHAKQIYLRWQDDDGGTRSRHYWLEAGFKGVPRPPATAPVPAQAVVTPPILQQPISESERHHSSELKFRQSAQFTEDLVMAIGEIVALGVNDRTSKPKHVNGEVAGKLGTTVEVAEKLVSQVVEAGFVHKVRTKGEVHYSMHPKGELPPSSSNGNTHRLRRGPKEKEDLRLTEEDYPMIAQTFDRLCEIGEGRMRVDDLAKVLSDDMGVPITFGQARFLLDKLKSNGWVYIDQRRELRSPSDKSSVPVTSTKMVPRSAALWLADREATMAMVKRRDAGLE